jgi:hypothetical protein
LYVTKIIPHVGAAGVSEMLRSVIDFGVDNSLGLSKVLCFHTSISAAHGILGVFVS